MQFCEDDDKADVITAVLLVSACNNSETDLVNVRVDVNTAMAQLQSIQLDDEVTLDLEVVSKEYCKTKVNKVDLYCICKTPWIEGSTSACIYGDRQKHFNMHQCCKCKNWYHAHCLESCGSKEKN